MCDGGGAGERELVRGLSREGKGRVEEVKGEGIRDRNKGNKNIRMRGG